MAPVATKRISYVLPLGDRSQGHRLGVNGLAFDANRSTLYSAGRDGVICAWKASQAAQDASSRGFADLQKPAATGSEPTQTVTYSHHVQAHTHWINDLCLLQGGAAIASASSDVSVKVWRPDLDTPQPPQTIGVHSDYVRRVAAPSSRSTWLAAGGLDRKVTLWNISGAGRQAEFEIPEEGNAAKGSIYALAANEALIATGGPESILKLWDSRSCQRVMSFVGHTDNIRDVLISRNNDIVMTASSDRTIKMWSIVAGRCVHTLGMHNDSVWSLAPASEDLTTFFSGDRSGYLVKTDTRSVEEADEGLSVALAQEHEGITKILPADGMIWTATSSSSINCWEDADLSAGVHVPDTFRGVRWSTTARTRASNRSPPQGQASSPDAGQGKIPFVSVLRISGMTTIPGGRLPLPASRLSVYSAATARKATRTSTTSDTGAFSPLRALPTQTIEGQDGLIKHIVLSDKQRVLTLDTVGNVELWDLLKCVHVQSFGKRNIDEVASEINTQTSITSWCTVDTRTGTLTCTIDEQHGFDAEIYLDETEFVKNIEFREDQRINLGRWVLRYLFAAFIDEEVRRNDHFRASLQLEAGAPNTSRNKPSMSLTLPTTPTNPWQNAPAGSKAPTPRAGEGSRNAIMTPGLAISHASPVINFSNPPSASTQLDGTSGPVTSSSQSRSSSEGRSADYFFHTKPSAHKRTPSSSSSASGSKDTSEASEGSEEKMMASSTEAKAPPTPGRFGKFFSNLNKSGKKLGTKSQSDEAKTGPAPTDQDDATNNSIAASGMVAASRPTTFLEELRLSRSAYEAALKKGQDANSASPVIINSTPQDAPILKPPSDTRVIIQEERTESGGAADLFEGTIGSLGKQADLIESVAPAWLADVLLKNRPPSKPAEYNKLKFLLLPWENELPWICKPDKTEHLNANRMLRARKMAAYVAEKLEPLDPNAEPDPQALRPDAYIDLYCNNKLLPPKMTLAWVRSHIWRGGGGSEMTVFYKANGRKPIVPSGTDLTFLGPAMIHQASSGRTLNTTAGDQTQPGSQGNVNG